MRSYQAICGLAVLGILVLAVSGQTTLPPELPNAWNVAPRVEPRLNAADLEARAQLLKSIHTNQTAEYRRYYRLLVPEHSSGVPDKYALRVFGKYIDWPDTAVVLNVHVDGAHATAELVDSFGIWRGELPVAEVEQLVRQLAYAYQTRVELKDADALPPSGFAWASHTPYFSVELIAKGDQPIELRTEAMQPLHDEISTSSEDLRGWAHTRLCATLLKQARFRLKALPSDEQQRIFVQRLQNISAEKHSGTHEQELLPVTSYQRDDKAAVELVLYAHLAIELCTKEALPELRRLGAVDAAKRLTIVSAGDSATPLAAAIRGDDFKLRQWALATAEKDRPGYLQMLVELLPEFQAERPDMIGTILMYLGDRPLNARQIGIVDSIYQKASKGTAKVETAGVLMNQTQDAKYFDYLLSVARAEPTDDADPLHDASEYAADFVFEYSGRTKRRREECYALLIKRLESMPAEVRPDSFQHFELVSHLGSLGTRADLPRLEKLADHESGYLAKYAIDATAKIDPIAAVRKARDRIDGFVARKGDGHDYSWNVSAHYELLFWRNSREAAPALRLAHKALLDRHNSWPIEDPQPLIDYLEAKDAASRLAAAIRFVEGRSIDPMWTKDVASELIAAGVKAEQCQLLLDRPRPFR